MVFVELTPFVAFRAEHWTDEDLRALQSYLLVSPDAGDLLRGGARIIYYWHVPGERIYLIYGYVKSEREDLTPQQIKALAELMKDVKHG